MAVICESFEENIKIGWLCNLDSFINPWLVRFFYLNDISVPKSKSSILTGLTCLSAFSSVDQLCSTQKYTALTTFSEGWKYLGLNTVYSKVKSIEEKILSLRFFFLTQALLPCNVFLLLCIAASLSESSMMRDLCQCASQLFRLRIWF